MKKYILMLSMVSFSFLVHASERPNQRIVQWEESCEPIYASSRRQLKNSETERRINALNAFQSLYAESKTTPQHLQDLYEIYKELEHAYASNFFYAGTQYEYKPTKRSGQVILKNLAHWNGFIRSRLKDKRNFNEEEIEIIQALQIHQKDAQELTFIIQKYTQWRHNDYEKREDFVHDALRNITLISDIYKLKHKKGQNRIKVEFDRELQEIEFDEYEEFSDITFKIPYILEWLNSIIPDNSPTD